MNTHVSICGTITLVVSTTASAGVISAGNLVLVQIGGNANTAGPISIVEVSASGTTLQTIAVPSGSGGLQVSGTATSEGQLSRNASGSSWTIAGYVAPYAGTGSLSSRNSTDAPRGFATVSSGGTVSSVTTLTGAFSGQNIRGGVQSGGSAWFAGSNSATVGGVMTFNGTSTTQVQSVNSRNVQVIGGDLYYSTGSGTQGLYRYAGLPAASATATAFLTGVTGQGTNPYDFELSADGRTMYVADSGIGVQKFTRATTGSAWTLAYNLTVTGVTTNAAFGLAVDWSSNTVYWTSPTNLYKAVDGGTAGTGSSIMSIAATSGAFRGLDFVNPVPAPGAVALLGVAGLIAGRRKR